MVERKGLCGWEQGGGWVHRLRNHCRHSRKGVFGFIKVGVSGQVRLNDRWFTRRVVHDRSSGAGAAPQNGRTALLIAVAQGHVGVVETLLAAGAAIDAPAQVRGAVG